MDEIAYPKGEKVCNIYLNINHEEQFVMTEKGGYASFTLWERDGNAWKKLGRSKSPTMLEEEHDVLKRRAGK